VGKVWKVLEFNVEIFKALKSLENDHRYGWKGLEKSSKTVMLTWKIQMSVTLLITDAFVNFLAVYDTKHVSEVHSSKI